MQYREVECKCTHGYGKLKFCGNYIRYWLASFSPFLFIILVQQPTQEVYSVVKLKETNLPKDCPLKSLQSRKLIKNFLLLGSGPSLTPGLYKDKLPEQKSRRSQIIVRNKELESEVVVTVLVFHPVKVNASNYSNLVDIKQHNNITIKIDNKMYNGLFLLYSALNTPLTIKINSYPITAPKVSADFSLM